MVLDKIEIQIQHEIDEIQHYYKVQEATLKTGVKGSQLQAFPLLVTAKEKKIKVLEAQKVRQLEYIEEKKKELAQLRGDLKVIENMKEKDYEQYRKAINKEIDQKVEEQTQNWLQHREKAEQ
jgi:flagellar FliJ protein